MKRFIVYLGIIFPIYLLIVAVSDALARQQSEAAVLSIGLFAGFLAAVIGFEIVEWLRRSA